MLKRLVGGILKRGAELAFSLGLVATSFLAILLVGTTVFPEGRGLRALVEERGGERGVDAASRERELSISRSETRESEIATLEKIQRKVKDRPATNIAWSNARAGISLGERHAIQTFDHSSATIAFDSANRLKLAENSLVVLRRYDQRADGSDRRATLLLSSGGVRGRIQSRTKGSVAIDVELPSGHATFRPDDEKDREAEFRIDVDEKVGTSRVSVFSGEAEVTSGKEKVKVGTQQTLQIQASGTVTKPIELPRPPRLHGSQSEKVTFRKQAPPVTFAWDPVPGAEAYVLRIASDPDFREIVYRTETQATSVEHGRLSAGRFLWSVSTVADGLEGSPGRPPTVILRMDGTPPVLQVDWPTGTVPESHVVIHGKTEPGAHVFASDKVVLVGADGRFSHRVPLVRGTNVIVVEAFDSVGNTAYESHMVNAEYGGSVTP